MKTEKFKLTAPKIVKMYSYRKPNAERLFETSASTDATTTCTTIFSTTHFNKI
jgi:hypothetical protein